MAEEKFDNITDMNNVDILWSQIKSCITETEEVCGKHVRQKWQQWMTEEILHKVEEKRRYKGDKSENGIRIYKDLKHEIQRLCRQQKNDYFQEKCAEIEKLEATHNPLLYKKIKN